MEPPAIASPVDPWVTAEDLPQACVEGADPTIVQWATLSATTTLWALSGRRFGRSPSITIRPTGDTCYALAGGPATTVQYGSRRRWPHGPDPIRDRRVLVLGGPIYQVDEVKVAGAVLAPDTDYVVEDYRQVRRLGGDRWPTRQRLDLPDTEPDTWSVKWSPGLAVPADGVYAAQVLACELIRARLNDSACRLPKRTRSVARQGVTIDVNAIGEYLVDGRLGVDECDIFLVAQNPHGLASRSTVMSPDLPQPRRVRR